MKPSLSILAAFCMLAFTANAQLETPRPSPTATISQKVGLTDVSITYSRPGMKGRTIFGDLVAYDKIWRTGANKATSITLSTDATIGGQKVEKGSYSIFTIPGKKEWTIIINKNTELWGAGDYDQSMDVARFKVFSTALKDQRETFTIDFSHFKAGEANINMMWENTKVTFKIETASDKMVDEQIKTLLIDGPDAGTYAGAAEFYLENNRDLEQALEWINIAIEKRPDAFWYIHRKAKILGKLGKTKEAIKTAEESMKMAKENKGGDFGYVRNNELLIKDLKNQ